MNTTHDSHAAAIAIDAAVEIELALKNIFDGQEFDDEIGPRGVTTTFLNNADTVVQGLLAKVYRVMQLSTIDLVHILYREVRAAHMIAHFPCFITHFQDIVPPKGYKSWVQILVDTNPNNSSE